jgi:hypothetical protein
MKRQESHRRANARQNLALKLIKPYIKWRRMLNKKFQWNSK